MIDTAIFAKPDAPWVIRDQGQFDELVARLKRSGNGSCLFILHGSAMRTLNSFYDEIIRVLRFPDYFGRNFNALSECLSDLEWLNCNRFILLFEEAEDLLADEPIELLDAFVDMLQRIGEEWSQPICVGEAWDRGAVPFHVIFHKHSQ